MVRKTRISRLADLLIRKTSRLPDRFRKFLWKHREKKYYHMLVQALKGKGDRGGFVIL